LDLKNKSVRTSCLDIKSKTANDELDEQNASQE